LLSQTVAGGAHCVSVLQPAGGSQWPVLELQTFPPVHCRPPICVQPGMHWLLWQIRLGGPHWESVLHPVCPWVQRPVVESQLVPIPQVRPPGLVHPGTHCDDSQTVLGGLQEKSAVHPPLPPSAAPPPQVPLTQGAPPPHCVLSRHSLHCWLIRSQWRWIALHCISEVQDRLPVMQTPVLVLHFWSAGQASSVMQVCAFLQTPSALSQYCPAMHASSVLQPGCIAETHFPPTQS
jgi:hypothetical protein